MVIKRINEFPDGSGSLTSDDIFLFMDSPNSSATTKKISLSQISSVLSSSSGVNLEEIQDNLATSFFVPGTGINFDYNDTSNKLTFNVSSAPRIITNVFNKTGTAIPKFKVIYLNGGQGDMPTISLAIANGEATSSKTYGITAENISHMSSGQIVVIGLLSDIDTDQFNPTAPIGDVNGTTLWLSPTSSGDITTTKPYAPNHAVSVGTIVRTHANAGIVDVRIQNGYELDELHNVKISGVSNKDVLVYNSGNNLWENTNLLQNISINTNTISSTSGDLILSPYTNNLSIINGDININSGYGYKINSTATSGQYLRGNGTRFISSAIQVSDIPTASISSVGVLSSGDWNTFNNKQNSLTDPVTGVGTSGYIAKWTSTSGVGNSLIYDNNTNIGIGTGVPAYKLDIVDATPILRVYGTTNSRGIRINPGLGTIDSDNVTLFLNRGTNNNIVLGQGSGSVGIGVFADTSTLLGKLDVRGNVAISGNITGIGNITASGALGLSTTSANNFTVSTNNSERLRIDSNGKVGIGTTSPSGTLHVVGTNAIYASGYINVYDDASSAYKNGLTQTITVLDGTNQTYNMTFVNGILVDYQITN